MASKNFEFFTTKYEQIAKLETLFILPTTTSESATGSPEKS